MLLGLIIRNFKSYETNHYIKVVNNKPNNLSFYVGVNIISKIKVEDDDYALVFATNLWAKELTGAQIEMFREFVMNNKPKISEHYFDKLPVLSEKDQLDWITKIKDFFIESHK